jgi:hypothetical protein
MRGLGMRGWVEGWGVKGCTPVEENNVLFFIDQCVGKKWKSRNRVSLDTHLFDLPKTKAIKQKLGS